MLDKHWFCSDSNTEYHNVEASNLYYCGLIFSHEFIANQLVSLKNVEKSPIENIDARECKLSL